MLQSESESKSAGSMRADMVARRRRGAGLVTTETGDKGSTCSDEPTEERESSEDGSEEETEL